MSMQLVLGYVGFINAVVCLPVLVLVVRTLRTVLTAQFVICNANALMKRRKLTWLSY